MTSSSVLKPSREFEPTTVQEADHNSCGHSLQPAQEADHRLSLCPRNHAAVHSFSGLSVHYSILAVAGNRIIKERFPQRKVLHD